jgi:hypothetical protein
LYYISPHVFAATEDEMKRPSVTIDTEVWSWGKNNRGQLGNVIQIVQEGKICDSKTGDLTS